MKELGNKIRHAADIVDQAEIAMCGGHRWVRNLVKAVVMVAVVCAFAITAKAQDIDHMTDAGQQVSPVAPVASPQTGDVDQPTPTVIIVERHPVKPGPRGATGARGPRGPRGPQGPAGKMSGKDLSRFIYGVNNDAGYMTHYQFNHAGSPATTASGGGTAASSTSGGTMLGISWGWLLFLGAVVAFIAWLITYMLRGPMPMWNRTPAEGASQQTAGYSDERSAHGDSRKMAPGPLWEPTKVSDFAGPATVVIRESASNGRHEREIVPADVAKARAEADAEIAHCRMTEAIAARQARRAERQALVAMIAQPQAVTIAGGGYALGLPQGGSGAAPEKGPRAYTAAELKELGIIRPPTPAAQKEEQTPPKKPAQKT